MSDAQTPALRYRALRPGDPAPLFRARSTSNERYVFDTAAGRYLVMCFFGSAADPAAGRMLSIVRTHRHLFDDERLAFFGVSQDSQDESLRRVQELLPGVRYFWDFDGAIAAEYGAAPVDAPAGAGLRLRQFWVILDPNMRVREVIAGAPALDPGHVAGVLQALPPVDVALGEVIQAPVLFLPRVIEPELCAELMSYYERHGGEDSGFMTEREGKTTLKIDYGHKRRSDRIIEDEQLKQTLQARVKRRIVPEIAKAHMFHVTRMERYLIGCYEAETGGHFRPHRDNTTKGTAHRRFAVTINLNADYDGGTLSFPEFGSRQFKPPPGGAVVFSCGLLHMVRPVTRGRRFAFLPFLYDEAAAAMREQNNQFLDETVAPYRHETPDRA